MIYSIYVATNKINGKRYVGYTNNFKIRRNLHRSGSRKEKPECLFHEVLKDEGLDNFTWEVIFQSKDKNYMRTEMEEYFIRTLRSHVSEWGYNIDWGNKQDISSIKKKAMALSGIPLSKEHRQKLSESHKGLKQSEESKRKKSEALKGRIKSDETRQRLSKAQTGKKHSEETRKAMREAWERRRLKVMSI